MTTRTSGYLFILLAATLWGTLGIFYKYLTSIYHLTPMVIIYWRAFSASLVLFAALIIFRKSELTFSKRHIGLFLALGVIGIAGFYTVYIYAITLIGVGIAAVLLYTSIIWVTLFNVFFQIEKLNWLNLQAS